MEIKLEAKWLMPIALLIIGLLAGMTIGQPRLIHLEENEKQSLLNNYQDTLDKQERNYQRQLANTVERLTERNQELIQENSEQNKAWRETFQDLNHTINTVHVDLNKTISDKNCSKK